MAIEDLKGMLQQMLDKKKADKATEDQQRQEKNDGDRNKILENVGKDFGGIIQPFIDKMGENSRVSAEELKRIISESVQVTAPNVDTAGIENVIAQAFANLKFPEPKVSVAAPIIPAPVIKLNSPDVKFPSSMKLEPNTKPFPVIMMDQGGKPMLFPTMGSAGPGFPMQTMDPTTNAIRVTGTVTIGSFNNSSQAIDSSGNVYSQANPMQVNLAAGGLDSTFVFQARTTNPTAVADGADVRPKGDKLGRLLTRNMQVRDLIRTAYVTLSTGTEATLITAAAGTFYDCIWMAFANTSTAAVQIDIRAVTAGNIVHTAYVPANSTVGWAPAVPWPQDATGNNWTVDMGDFTNSNVLITALFSQEI